MRISLSALGLPLVVLACAPVTRTFEPGSGGATSSSSSADTSSASTGGSGGSGGSGGKAPSGSCTKVGAPFDILTPAELGASAALTKEVLLVPDQKNIAMVHVVLQDSGLGRVLVRTVVDNAKVLGNFVQFGTAGAPPFKPRAAWGGGYLHIEGTLGNSIQELNFSVDPDSGVITGGKANTYPTPIECLQGGGLGTVAFAQDGEKARYLASCLPSPAGGPALLFAGGWTGQPVQIASGMPSSTLMQPSFYSFVGSTHLAFFSGPDGKSAFSHGATVQELAGVQPFLLTTDPDSVVQGIFATIPRPADDGVTIIGAHFNVKTSTGQYWTGSLLTQDYATLSQVPPPGFAPVQDILTVKDTVTPAPPSWSAQKIVSAGATPDDTAVRLYWLTREGKPLVFGQEVYKSADTAVREANAAPFGGSAILVVWTERTGASEITSLVRGQRMTCKID
ncbi:MAG: hypothetical protein ACMG6S_14975 [Byssovorax sp.]